MMVDDSFDKTEVKDVIMEVFAESDKGKSLQIIENHPQTMDEGNWHTWCPRKENN